MTGWEILGICGSTWFFDSQGKLTVKQNIKNTVNVQYLAVMGISTNGTVAVTPSGCLFKDFCGGYGNASFSLLSLMQRAQLGMARFSEGLGGYTWIKFKGASFQLVPSAEVDYLFRLQNHAQGAEQERKDENKWIHPGTMLLLPGTKIVESIKRTKCCKWKHIRYRPPPLFEGWYDIENFSKYILTSYEWTTVSLNNPMGIPPYKLNNQNTSDDQQGDVDNNWWKDGTKCTTSGFHIPTWLNREAYNSEFNSQTGGWWDQVWSKKPKCSPFCPPVFTTEHQNTLWVRYKFWFQVGGTTLENQIPQYPLREVNPPPGKCGYSCTTCINPEEDLDATGILTEKAFKRITGTGDQKQRLLKKLIYILRRQQQTVPKTRIKWGGVQTRYFSE